MGLDGVELVIAVEESFEIEIEAPAAAQIITVGDLHRLVLSLLPRRSKGSCLGRHVFYRLRAELRRLRGTPRAAFLPRAALDDLLPVAARRSDWRVLARRLGWRLPLLERPWLIEAGLPIALMSLIPIAVIGGAAGLLSPGLAWILGLAAIPVAVALLHLTAPLAVHLPAGCGTVGGTAREIVRLNFGALSRQQISWSEAEVWDSLRAIVAAQLGVSPDRVTPEARFVEDLGMD